MKKLIYTLVVVVCFSLASQAKTTTETTTVLFNTAKHELTKKASKKLDQFLKQYHNNPDYEVTIEGHTDSRGNIEYNKQLSLNRAEEVKQFLIGKGIDENRIAFNYKGELDPEKPNVNDKNMEANRRVEVTFTTYNFESIEELELALNPNKTNSYVINPSLENLIKGKKGVKVLVPENSFTYEDGTVVTEDIKFELTESLEFKDFISSGLLTKSADNILETGGMIKIEAETVTGKPVKIQSGKDMLVAIPNKNRKDNMEVFTSNAGDDWATTNQPITRKVTYAKYGSFPVMQNNNIKLPEFKYDKEKPVAPVSPKKVREPHEPKKSGYLRHIPWYKFNKDEKRASQQKQYEKALDRYDVRVERYDKNVERYNDKMELYKSAQSDYLVSIDCWEEEKIIARNEFKKTPLYQKALKKHDAIYEVNLTKHKKRVEAWRKAQTERADKRGREMDKLGITNAQEMNNYVFAFNQLSWINVDRFYHMKEKDKQMIVMKTDEIKDERVLILFKNIGSMLSMSLNVETKEYVQTGFPKKEEAVIFAYKVENGKPMICYREIDGSTDYHLDYMETTFSEIKGILSQFDEKKRG